MKTHTLVATFSIICLAIVASAATQKANRSLAQKIIDDAHRKHPDAAELGIAIVASKGCLTIASTDKTDIGEKCEAEDAEPIRTGKPQVEKEGKNLDVTLPLHDAAGAVVGSVGIELAQKPGEVQADTVKHAQEIAREMEQGIRSKAALTQTF
jgi:hypothetical protein